MLSEFKLRWEGVSSSVPCACRGKMRVESIEGPLYTIKNAESQLGVSREFCTWSDQLDLRCSGRSAIFPWARFRAAALPIASVEGLDVVAQRVSKGIEVLSTGPDGRQLTLRPRGISNEVIVESIAGGLVARFPALGASIAIDVSVFDVRDDSILLFAILGSSLVRRTRRLGVLAQSTFPRLGKHLPISLIE